MSFSRDIAGFRKKTIKRTIDLKRAVSIKLFSAIIQDTPVETGRLRANWNTSLNIEDKATRSELDKEGALATALVESKAALADLNDALILCNSLPYARVAEFGEWSGPTDKVTGSGFSRKAPAGMVRKNVDRFKQLLNDALSENFTFS